MAVIMKEDEKGGIIEFSNLIQPHSNGIIGDFEMVRARVPAGFDLKELENVSARAKAAAERFRARLGS